MSSPTDNELMLEVRDGDLAKLGTLFERHHKKLYNFFLRLTGKVVVSEDLVQEVFFRILKYKHTYRGESQFTVWMFKIARNARVDHFQKTKKMEPTDVEEAIESSDLNPDQEIVSKQDQQILHAALNKLSDEEREVLLLSRFSGIKYKEIANIFDCLEGTIKARVHRAIKKLRDTFYELSGESAL